MRNPENLKITENSNIEVLVFDHIPQYDKVLYDINNEKSIKGLILEIKSMCRKSREYKKMVSFLRDFSNMNECSFYKNINNVDTRRIKIHIHHDPFTIEDIISIVLNKYIIQMLEIEPELIAKEVMYLHYKNLVGLIPLAETPHNLVHNQFLFIPIDKVYGNVKQFVDLYELYMTPEQKYLYNEILEYSKVYDEALHKNILDVRFLYIDASGVYSFPQYSLIKELMINKIESIKNSYKNDTQNSRLINPIKFFDENGKEVLS